MRDDKARHLGATGQHLFGVSDVASVGAASFDIDGICDFAASVGASWRAVREHFAEDGKRLHAAIAFVLRSGGGSRVAPVPGDGYALAQWFMWASAKGIIDPRTRHIIIDEAIIDEARQIGCTPDLVTAPYGTGPIAIFDWKRSKVLRVSHVVQVCGQMRTLRETGLDVRTASVVRLPLAPPEKVIETIIAHGSETEARALTIFDAGLDIIRVGDFARHVGELAKGRKHEW